jgi:AcrR family transcriptional regulator
MMTRMDQVTTQSTGPGLRERKKQQTKERLISAALFLFRERGYEGATVEAIAERAEVSVTTFFRYFDSKEDVFLEGHRAIIDRVEAAIRERPPGVSVIAALRRTIVEILEAQPELEIRDEPQHKDLDAVPELRDRIRDHEEQIRGAITDAYAEQLGVPASDMRPRLLAGAILSAFDSARTAWLEDRTDVSLGVYLTNALDIVEQMTLPVLFGSQAGGSTSSSDPEVLS